MNKNILNEIKNMVYEAEGLIELMQLRDDKIGELLPLLKVRLGEALSLAGGNAEPVSGSAGDAEKSVAEEEDAGTMYEIDCDDEIDDTEEEAMAPAVADGPESAAQNTAEASDSARRNPVFCLNDRFRFRRALFGGSDSEFNSVMDHVATLSGYDEMEDYFYGELGLDPDDTDVADFMEIMKTYIEK